MINTSTPAPDGASPDGAFADGAFAGATSPGATSTDTGGLAGAIGAVAVRPWLWTTAVRQVFMLARPGWWHRWPLLPLPDRDYLGFRLQTAYGDSTAQLKAHDVVSYLHWCRAWPRVAGRSG